jgi:hypothetical protein
VRPAAVSSAAADVAVTDGARPDRERSTALIFAALALPGILPANACAQAAPDEGVVALRYHDYRDWQPGAARMSVRSPSLYARVPLGEQMTVETTLIHDTMSGASPLFHDTLSGASGIGVTDHRAAGDVKLTTYVDGNALAAGVAYSHERDYVSRAASLEWRHWSDDRNRTYAVGIGAARDRIDSTNDVATNRRRETYDVLFGVTQVLNASAVIESSLTWSQGRGYYSDPYKFLDARPERRRILTWLTRYNRYLSQMDATVRIAYRYLDDSFGDRSHMVEASWVQALPAGFTLTPTLRYYTQGAATFYRDPPFPQGFVDTEFHTADTRLSAFGAVTAGLRIARDFPGAVTVDVAFNFYRQKSAWRAGGGSPGLEDFSARWIEAGIEKRF